MIVTTLDYVPGKEIVEHYGIVNGSSVRARNFNKDIVAGIKNIFGGELKEYTQLIDDTRDEAIQRLILVAQAKGANAVINVRLTTSDVAAGAAEVLAYGTAVKVG
jgi:uncharacterized protein YbjQ (UPF0145 family)